MQYLILSTEKLMYAFYSQRESMLCCGGVIYGRSVVILVSRSELFDDISPALAAENVLALHHSVSPGSMMKSCAMLSHVWLDVRPHRSTAASAICLRKARGVLLFTDNIVDLGTDDHRKFPLTSVL